MKFRLPLPAGAVCVLIAVLGQGVPPASGAAGDNPAGRPADLSADAVMVRVVSVLDGDTVAIDPPVRGLSRLRLAGIGAVKPPLGRPPDRPWPLAAQAADALAKLVQGATIRIELTPQGSDRYGRLLGQAFLTDGRWLQGELLRAGLARVVTTTDSRARAPATLAIEAEARAAHRGLWSSPVYAVRSPIEVHDQAGDFAVVEGAVVEARRVKNRIYLNFGADWRTDFTVTIDAANLPLFESVGLDPLALTGRRVRVRGWVERYNGPAIEATHPEQIEVLAPETE